MENCKEDDGPARKESDKNCEQRDVIQSKATDKKVSGVEKDMQEVDEDMSCVNESEVDVGKKRAEEEEEEEEEIPINPACEEQSRNMYICDLIIGDVFICQALSGHKLQAKSCAARNVSSGDHPFFIILRLSRCLFSQ